jgi:hypothetical protein
MTAMPITPAHAKPVSRRDHLWVLAIIAASVLAEVWASWVGIGAISGFPAIGHIPTDWVLAMAMEAYWAYALYAWLVASPGRRSRSMAMWSCGVVFVLSLIGQVLYHEITAPAGTPIGRRVVIGFVTSLPVIVLALIAVLIHLRHLDRAEEAEAAEAVEREARRVAVEEAKTDERVTLRAELEASRDELEAAVAARDDAQREAEEATAKAGRLTRKLATSSGSGRGRNGRTRQPANGGRKGADTQVPRDVDARAEALALWSEDPAISGAKLGAAVGKSERWGQLLKSELATVPADPEERPA